MVQLYKRKGGEVLVNTETLNSQFGPNVGRLAGGGFLVTWTDNSLLGGDDSVQSVKAQRYDAGGNKLGGEFLVNTTITGSQANPQITTLNSGNFVIVWQDASGVADADGFGLKAQLYQSDGTRIGSEFPVNTITQGTQDEPSVVALAGGGFVVSWRSFQSDGAGIVSQIFDANGARVGGEVNFASTTYVPTAPEVMALDNGGFAIVGVRQVVAGGGGFTGSVNLQLFDAAGARVGSQQTANTELNYRVSLPKIAALDDGFVVVWSREDTPFVSGSPATNVFNLRAQLFDAAGNKVGGEFMVNTTTAGNQTNADIDRLPDGGFIVTWQGTAPGSTDINLFAQVFDEDGDKVGNEFMVNLTTSGNQLSAQVSVLPSGDIVITWQDSSGTGGDTGTGVKMQILTLSDDAPTDIALSDVTVSEIAVGNLSVATLSSTSNALNSDPTYEIVTDETGGGFRIEGNRLVVADPTKLDFETNPSVEVRIRATDANGMSYEETLTLTIENAVIEARYSAGDEFLTNTATPDFSNPVGSAALGSGGFVVLSSWLDSGPGGFSMGHRFQVFDAAGNKVGTEHDLVVSPNVFGTPAIAGLSSGGFVITYEPAGSGQVRAQLFDAAGAADGTEFVVATSGTGFYGLSAAGLDSGAFVVTWTSNEDEAGGGGASAAQIRARIFNADGDPLGAEFRVNTGIEGAQRFSHVASLPDGGFVITWTDEQTPQVTLEGQRFDAGGNKVGAELTIASGFDNLNTELVVLPDGSFVAIWTEVVLEDDISLIDIKGQVVGADGVNVGGPITLATQASAGITYGTPKVAATADGGFVLTWDSLTAESVDGDDVDSFARFFSATGAPIGETFMVSENRDTRDGGASVVLLASGDIAFNWYQGFVVSGESQSRSAARILDYLGTIAPPTGPTEGPDILNGTPGGDVIDGLGGDDVINGLGGDDLLFGGAGDDAMAGGIGNDIYYVDSAADTVTEAANEGRDVVYASVSYTLGAGQEIEVLSTVSQAAGTSINLTGNGIFNEIYGNAGDNVIDGGGGSDYLQGYAGNDIYFVDHGSDLVVEAAGGGRDVIYTSVNFTLGASSEIEVLSTTSSLLTDPLELTGNSLFNEIYGNAGANIIDGGGGPDYLRGYGGNDIYLVNHGSDYIFEIAGEGTRDVVYARVSFTLAAGVDIEVLSVASQGGGAAIDLTGNELVNELYGNAEANYLDGGAGADYLQGYGGNDSYVVETQSDIVIEAAGEGRDVVFARASYTLGAGQQIEVLSAISGGATTAIDLTGNALANELYGNAGANVLNGGLGADYLQGFGGADTFAFTTALGGGNVDQIGDFVAGTDKLALDDAVFTGLTPGALPAGAFVTGSQAADADDRIVYNSATGQLFFDADGSGAGAAVQFATLSPGLTLAASDFMVI